MQNNSIPVMIIGGGPVGLFSSLLLARSGVSSLLVERHLRTSIHPRARGINVRTMELMREVGLADAVKVAGAPLAANRFNLVVETLAGREIQRAPSKSGWRNSARPPSVSVPRTNSNPC